MSIKDALKYTQTLLADGELTAKDFDLIYQYWGLLRDLDIPCDFQWDENKGEYILKLT